MTNARMGFAGIASLAALALIGTPVLHYSQAYAQRQSVRLASLPDASPRQAPMDVAKVTGMLASWPDNPKDAAMKLMSKYGGPNEATASTLTWYNNGPWKRTILFRDEIPHEFPKHHTDFLQQFIDYRVPTGKFSDLAKYDGSVICERTKGEISARCDKEEMNMLALNLANDIVTGKRNVSEARKFYGMAAMAFMKGEAPPYTQSFQFSVPIGQTADPDHAMKMQ